MDGNIKKLTKKLKKSLLLTYGQKLRGLYLFGSYSKNLQKTGSDLDIAIILDSIKDYWMEIKKTSNLISNLSLEYDVTISPVRIKEVDWKKENSPFLKEIKKDAIEI